MKSKENPKEGSRGRRANSKKVRKKKGAGKGDSAKAATEPAAERKAEKDHEHQLLRVLLHAESAGIIRWVLQGAAAAFGDLPEQRKGPHQLPPESLHQRRRLVAKYVASLLRDFDALTLAEIVRDLLFQFRIRGTTSGHERATEAGVSVVRDDLASTAILFVMRNVADLYCEAALEMPETFGCELTVYTSKLVETLNEIASMHPEHVQDVASGMIAWPIMAAAHYPKRSDFKVLAERILLGKNAPVRPRERQTWKPDTPVNRYLVDMLINEGWGGGRPLTKDTLSYYLDEVLMPLFDKVETELGGWENYPEFSAIAQKAAKRGKKGVQRSEIRNRVERALRAFTN